MIMRMVKMTMTTMMKMMITMTRMMKVLAFIEKNRYSDMHLNAHLIQTTKKKVEKQKKTFCKDLSRPHSPNHGQHGQVPSTPR